MAFTKDQPKHGDTLLHCGHFGDKRHWFKFESPTTFERPDKTRGQAEWFVSCDACFMKHGDDVAKFVRGDGIWTGNGPIVEEILKS